MRTGVVVFWFVVCLGAFSAWLAVILRQERAQKLTMARVSQQRTRAHRRHTLAAQRASVIPLPATAVAKAGSFCRVPGLVGHSKKGTTLVCETGRDGKHRWRRSQPLSIAS
jgi:hypothetical protein